jgi:hypothetical protein
MEHILALEFGVPALTAFTFIIAGRSTSIPQSVFVVVGSILVFLGFALGSLAALFRGALIPGEYSGWPTSAILLDQLYISGAVGGGAILFGSLLILFRKRLSS